MTLYLYRVRTKGGNVEVEAERHMVDHDGHLVFYNGEEYQTEGVVARFAPGGWDSFVRVERG